MTDRAAVNDEIVRLAGGDPDASLVQKADRQPPGARPLGIGMKRGRR